jgi:putative exosortase-associated protein (TIGR04073 family)
MVFPLKKELQMKKMLFLAILLAGLICSSNAFADSVYEKANSTDYGTKVGGMLGRGVVNVATCFVDIIVQTVNGTQDGPPVVGTLTGLGGGIACGALRVSSGALDVLTFWVPQFNGIPVSRSYSNCLEEPEDGIAAPAVDSTPLVAAQAPAPRARNTMDYVKK